MQNVRHIIATFAKAQCSASVGTMIDFGSTLILKEVLGMWYVAATCLGSISGGMTNCVINYRWVFHAQGMKKRFLALRYLFVWTVSIILNTLGTTLVKEGTGINYIVAKAIVSCMVAVLWSFPMQKGYVFARKNRRRKDPVPTPCN